MINRRDLPNGLCGILNRMEDLSGVREVVGAELHGSAEQFTETPKLIEVKYIGSHTLNIRFYYQKREIGVKIKGETGKHIENIEAVIRDYFLGLEQSHKPYKTKQGTNQSPSYIH